MSDRRFGVSPVNYPDPDPEKLNKVLGILFNIHQRGLKAITTVGMLKNI